MACAGSFEVLSLLAKKGWEDQAEMNLLEGKRERVLRPGTILTCSCVGIPIQTCVTSCIRRPNDLMVALVIEDSHTRADE